jgi:hypothetical protein
LSIDGTDKSLAARPLPREEPAFFLTIDQRTAIVCLPCPATRMLLACVHTACYPTRLSPFLVILTACPYPSDNGLALAHQTRPSLTSSFGRALTKHFLAGSTSAQPLLRPHRHSSVLTSSAHPRAQATSKCCSGCSPSPHPCLVPVLGPYYNWISAPCSYLSFHEFDQL